MPCKYDPDTLTLFDLETGASVATIHVPDNGSFEEAHRIGYLMAAAEGMREALRSVLIGGNHVALLIGADHPLHTASHDAAMAHYATRSQDAYEAWCCWRTIMHARDVFEAAEPPQ